MILLNMDTDTMIQICKMLAADQECIFKEE